MKKRILTQVIAHKAIYRKHATVYKLNDYPVHRAKRMMAYTSLLTKAIALTGSR